MNKRRNRPSSGNADIMKKNPKIILIREPFLLDDELRKKVVEWVEWANNEYGINVSSALVIDVELDDTLTEKIRAKEQAKQDAEIAELNKQTALAQAETDKVKAQTEADVKVIEAQAEAESNRIVSESITPELIQMKEAEARLKHGWVTVNGADTVVTKAD